MIVSDSIELTSNLSGEIWECGTHRGDTAIKIKKKLDETNNPRVFRMFDTFTGQPFSGPFDIHKQGSMDGAFYDKVKERFDEYKNIYIHSGIMPFTFSGLKNIVLSISNIDVDNYDSVKDCLEFIYSRTESGGYIFLDDYGCPNCLGAKKAVDEFMIGKKEYLCGNAPAYIIKQ